MASRVRLDISLLINNVVGKEGCVRTGVACAVALAALLAGCRTASHKPDAIRDEP